MFQEERDKKKTEQVEKKQELRKLHDEEMNSLKSKSTTQPSAKLTRAQIEAQRQKEEAGRSLPEISVNNRFVFGTILTFYIHCVRTNLTCVQNFN